MSHFSHIKSSFFSIVFSFSILFSFFQVTETYAINILSEGYRIPSLTSAEIDMTSLGGQCKLVTAPAGNDHFIATKSLPEWNTFEIAAPTLGFTFAECIAAGTCAPVILGAGGTGSDYGYSTTSDSEGNILVTGYFSNTAGIFGTTLTSSGGYDIFVAKLSSTGGLLWIKQGGGTSSESAYSIASDSDNNIIVTGYFSGITALFGSSFTTSGSSDIFLAKLDTSGNPLWVKKGGSTATDYSYSNTFDSLGNIFVTGKFQGTADIFGQSLTSSGNYDMFVAKLSSTGNLMWAKKGGGTYYDTANTTASDPFGNILIGGFFDGTADIFGQSLSSSGGEDFFLAKLSSTGGLIWAKKGGGSITYDDGINGVITDAVGDIYITGYYGGGAADILGYPPGSYYGMEDIFLVKLSSTGGRLWAMYGGGGTADVGTSLAIDTTGNILVTGYFMGTADIFGESLTSSGGLLQDVFVSKFSPSGALLWMKQGGGTGKDISRSISTDPSGNVIVTGEFSSSTADFFGWPLTSEGFYDIFLAKLTPDGEAYYYSDLPTITQVGGSSDDNAIAMITDASGSIYVGGTFEGTADIFGSYFTSSGASDIFLAKLTSRGLPLGPFIYGAGGILFDTATSTSTDSSGNILVTGYFEYTADIFGQSFASLGSSDLYIAKLYSTGGLLWAKSAGGIGADSANSTTTDSSGNIIVTGDFQYSGTDIFGQSLTSSGSSDIFLAKLSSTGGLIWAKRAGGTSNDSAKSTTTDASGSIFITGEIQGSVDIFGQSLTSSGGTDIFLAKLTSTGGLIWAKRAGGTSGDSAYSLVTDSSGNIFVAGSFGGTGTDIFGQLLTSSGNSDIFLAKLSSTGGLIWAKRAGGTSGDNAFSLTTDSSDNIVISGYFDGTTDIFGSPFTSSGTFDIFLAKLTSTGGLLWAKKAGSIGWDVAYSTSTDSLDNILVTGYFNGGNVDIFGQSLTSLGSTDVFLAKLSSTGGLIWSKRAGGILEDQGYSTTTDSSGNILVTGNFMGTGTNIFGQSLTSAGYSDIFFAKLDPDGNAFTPDDRTNIRKAGGSGVDTLRDLDTDASGNIFVAGAFRGTDTDIFSGLLTSSGLGDIFIAKLDALTWNAYSPPYISKQGGGTGSDIAYSTASDPSGNVFVAGNFAGTANLFGQILTGSGGSSDAFLAKLSSTGNLMWVKQGGGTSGDNASSAASDPSGNVFVAGNFAGTANLFGQILTGSGGSSDAFLAKLSSTGNLIWIKQGGGTIYDNASSTASDPSGNVFVAGNFQGTANLFGQILTSSGATDIFLAKLSSTGNLMWIKQGGGTNIDSASSTSSDPSGNVLVTGNFEGTSNIFGQSLTSSGSSDAYLAKLSSTGNLMWVKRGGGTGGDIAYSTSSDSLGNVLVAGNFEGTANLFSQSLTSSGLSDAYLVKLSSTGGLLWAKKGGGTSFDSASSTASDSLGNVLVSGYFQGTAHLFGQSLTSSGLQDIFLAKLTSTGNLMWVKQGGGTTDDRANSTSSDPSGNILFTGRFSGTADIFGQSLTSSGSYDIFLSKLDPDGNPMDGFRDPDPFVYRAGGTGEDSATAVATDSGGSIWVSGYFEGTDTDIFGTPLSSLGSKDIFLSKFTSEGAVAILRENSVIVSAGGTSSDIAYSTASDPSGNVLVSGYFAGTADLFGQILTSSGSSDAYLAKLSSTGNLMWVKQGGGTSADTAYSTASDPSGNVLVTGYFIGSANLFGQILTGSGGSADAFLAKLSSTGNLMWVVKGGGTSSDSASSTASDPSGNVFVAGNFQGTANLFGQILTSSGGSLDAFLAKLSSTGNLMWVVKGGGTSSDSASSTASDPSGNVFVAGNFQGTANLFGQILTSSGGSLDAFLAKLSSTGNLIWVVKGGGTSSDSAYSTASDPSGNALVAGTFNGTVNLFGQILTSSGGADAFLAKLSSTGNLMWIKQGGGTSSDSASSTASDPSGNVFVGGTFAGTANLFGQILTSSGSSDAFLAKLSSTGNLIWVKQGGGTSFDTANSTSSDPSGNVLVSGAFQGTANLFGQNLTSSGGYDAFLAKLTSDGEPYPLPSTPYIFQAGGSSDDIVESIIIDASDNMILAGSFQGTDTDIFGESLTSSGGSDIFLAKLLGSDATPYSPPYTPKQAGGAGYDASNAINRDSSGNILVTGQFEGTASVFGQTIIASGYGDAFVAKLSSTGGLIWARSAGGIDYDSVYGNSVCSDSYGNILVTGIFGRTSNIFGQSLTASGLLNQDIFIAKLSSTGGLLWARGAGGSESYGNAMTTDISGNILVMGAFLEDQSIFGQAIINSGGDDTFLAKLSSTGGLIWVRSTGGVGNEVGQSLVTDQSGSIFITGEYGELEGTADIFGTTLTYSGDLWTHDIFLAKLSSTGGLLWVHSAGGIGTDIFDSNVVTDSIGNILVTGGFSGTADIFGQSLTSSGNTDGFIAKLSSTGVLLWAHNIGGVSYDSIGSISSDSSDNILITGTYMGVADILGESLTGTSDAFVAKISSTGGLIWAKKAGGNGDSASSISTDTSGNILLTGRYYADMDFFRQSITNLGSADIFVSKLDPDGNPDTYFTTPAPLVYRAGGSGSDSATALATDGSGNMYVGGYFAGTHTDIFGTTLSSSGSADIFLSKLSPTGTTLWSRRAGGTGGDTIEKIILEPDGDILVTGSFSSTADIFGTSLTSSGSSDIYIAKLDTDGNTLSVEHGGGTTADTGKSLVVNDIGETFLLGNFSGIGTDIFGTPFTSYGGDDIFLARIGANGITYACGPTCNSDSGPVDGALLICTPSIENGFYCAAEYLCTTYESECAMIASGAILDEVPSLCGGGGGSEF